MEKDIAPHAASDIHGINSEFYNLRQYHRPMTLVFATERTEDAIREALFENRTIAWFGNTLAGKEEFLTAFFHAAVKINFIEETGNEKKYALKNSSDVPYFLVAENGREFVIPALGENLITISSNTGKYFNVLNLLTSSSKNLKVEINSK
jgi:hypothetical protein